MAFLPLSLGVGREPVSKGAAGSAGDRAETEKVLRRDSFSCRCCGFTSKRHQRVVSHPSLSEGEMGGLATVCSFCEMDLVLEMAGQISGAILLWLPEISQADLNHALRALYIAKASNGPLADAASRTLEVLLSRRTEAKKRLGTDDPLILATALLESVDEEVYAARTAKLEGLRLMPQDRYLVRSSSGDVNIFPRMRSFWTSSEGPFKDLPVDRWASLFETLTTKVRAFSD